MHCFNHPTYEAAGICRNCGRALCHDCIAIREDAIACKNKCEARVEAIQRMIATNQITSSSLPTQLWQSGIYAVASGLLFLLMGTVFFVFVGGDFGHLLGGCFFVLGVLIAIRGASAMKTSRKYPRTPKADASPTTSNLERF
jgi:hypothetical protein